jgi:hypothetical protein
VILKRTNRLRRGPAAAATQLLPISCVLLIGVFVLVGKIPLACFYIELFCGGPAVRRRPGKVPSHLPAHFETEAKGSSCQCSDTTAHPGQTDRRGTAGKVLGDELVRASPVSRPLAISTGAEPADRRDPALRQLCIDPF